MVVVVCRAGPFVVMSWDFYRGNVLLLWVLRIVDVILGRDLVLKPDISALYHEAVNDEVKDGPQDSLLVAQSLHQGPIQVQEFGRGIWTSSATSITVLVLVGHCCAWQYESFLSFYFN